MKSIEIEDDLYQFIASQTKHIGESASDILRRLLMPESPAPVFKPQPEQISEKKVKSEEVETAAPDNGSSQPINTNANKVFDLLSEDVFAAQKSRVEQFLLILSALHQVQPDKFAAVLDLKGKSRVYFALDKQALLATGSSTNPKQVPDSQFWVVTNNNTGKKVAMLREVASVLGYSEHDTNRLAKLFAPELF